MTIQMKVGLQRLQTLSALPPEADWVSGLPDTDLSNSAEVDEPKRLKLQYTSLRDLISVSPTKRGSPKLKELDWCDLSHVQFKDRLLKQAARAYLQPMGVEPTPEMSFLARCWERLAIGKPLASSIKEYLVCPVDAGIGFLRTNAYPRLSYAFGRLMQRIKPRFSRFLRVSLNK